MKFDKYTNVARIFPAVITVFPIIILNSFLLDKEISEIIGQTNTLFLVVEHVSVPVVFIYFFMQLNRLISKHFFEERMFKSGLNFPTTYLLLPNNKVLSKDYKTNILKKIASEFGINIESEKRDTKEVRKKVCDAVGLVRTKVKDGRLVLQHNIEYGFVRNLIGGSVTAVTISVLDLILSYLRNEISILTISVALGFFYLIVLVLSKFLLKKFGENYAKVLFQEYLAS